MNIKENIYKIAKKFLTWVGDLMVATKPPKTTAKEILKLIDVIEPGYVVCRMYSYYLDSYLIPGEYSHSGIVISKDKMAHSIAEGVGYIHPIDFVKDTDGFVILRPFYSDPLEINKVISKAIWHVEVNKTEYDFLFNDSNRFYCHEFTVDCISQIKIENEIQKTNVTFGIWPIKFSRNVYLASNIVLSCENIYEFK